MTTFRAKMTKSGAHMTTFCSDMTASGAHMTCRYDIWSTYDSIWCTNDNFWCRYDCIWGTYDMQIEYVVQIWHTSVADTTTFGAHGAISRPELMNHLLHGSLFLSLCSCPTYENSNNNQTELLPHPPAKTWQTICAFQGNQDTPFLELISARHFFLSGSTKVYQVFTVHIEHGWDEVRGRNDHKMQIWFKDYRGNVKHKKRIIFNTYSWRSILKRLCESCWLFCRWCWDV